MDVQGLAHDLAHRHAGVEGGAGVLEDDLHLAPVGQHVHGDPVLAVVDGRAVVDDPARCGVIQPDDGAPQRGLAAAGLADEAQGLAPVDGEGDGLDRLHVPGPEHPRLHREVLAEVLDLD